MCVSPKREGNKKKIGRVCFYPLGAWLLCVKPCQFAEQVCLFHKLWQLTLFQCRLLILCSWECLKQIFRGIQGTDGGGKWQNLACKWWKTSHVRARQTSLERQLQSWSATTEKAPLPCYHQPGSDNGEKWRGLSSVDHKGEKDVCRRRRCKCKG